MNKYEFVPASIDSLAKNSMIGVRYRTPTKTKNNTSVHDSHYHVETIKNGVVCHMSDRSVYFMKATEDFNNRLTALDFDVLHDSDYFMNKGLLSEMGYNYAMVNTHAVPRKYHHVDYAAERANSKLPWPEIIADSGGFQIRTGVADFLSPKETIEMQAKVCSIGIALDIPFPCTHRDEVSLFRRAAFVQKANNEVYKKYKAKGLKIMNVIHGPNFHLIDRYREVIEDDDIDLVSVGGVVNLELTPLVFRLMNVMLKGKKYKHYHALGVSGVERWIMLCYLAHKGIAPLITSDSTTYLKCGFNLQYFEPRRLCYSTALGSDKPNVEQHRRLACNCPICSTVGFSSPLNDRAIKEGPKGVVAHNLFLNRSYLNEIYQVTAMPRKEVLEYFSSRINRKKLTSVSVALGAVDMALQDGLEKAAAKYSPYLLSKDPTTHVSRSGLFDGVSTVGADTQKMRKRVDSVLKMFEDHHGMSGSTSK